MHSFWYRAVCLICLWFKTHVCFQAEEDLRQNKACPVHAVDQTVHTDEEKAIREVVDNVLWQMAADRKTTALKQLQGHMWRAAYLMGKIKGE